ncbi:hypothetical protein CKAH01_11530 [Colletotrichum kahawae]|uniref:Bubble protein n=1 Tax=Colletotrichum kahawae TaxID=34407 RepID=A0AAD9YWR1_COLKA|nr:hypothetical protein CKAH01_11530 [Colletotrichum kahawae]
MVRLTLVAIALGAVATVTARTCPGGWINCYYANGDRCTAGCKHAFWGCGCDENKFGSTVNDSECTNAFGVDYPDC